MQGRESTLVFGQDPDEFPARRLVIVAGRRPQGEEALVGDIGARSLGLEPGDTVDGRGPRFRVAGLYHSGNRFVDGARRAAADDRSVASRRAPGEVTTFGVTVTLGQRPDDVAKLVEERVPGAVAVTEPGAVVKVDTSSRLIIDAGWIFSVMALIVGGIGVLNTMAMSVFERIQEIGIMRAVGWRKRRIALLILSEATGIGLIALGLGLALGYIAAELFTSQGQHLHARRAGLHGRRLRLGARVRARRGADRRALPGVARRQPEADRGAAAGVAAWPSSTRPSRMRSVRSAAPATTSSFVTSMIVIPRSARSRSSRSTI